MAAGLKETEGPPYVGRPGHAFAEGNSADHTTNDDNNNNKASRRRVAKES
eukprot:CAMPEP_0206480288 /NCGR_PEP_ID=MMETSP0324_2-20121206/37179_1 /ASSEMBLY_ACC=CAM_ASM_000836 /TAXON_ID=2866 /ORGANISM="Crypthecodinium cohnii, Strain Seligo" /LENGTH=49 /DNA_ID=CAMNT_0053956995 /DNA_START=28 /DNA_END=177 /DNA_ORIENTATION=+